ncbi:MAG: hypothetical protein HFI31_17100 [Lachnospiraceae bacterium]|nr:hypothetical protein [Lachnospiraceae bacterium]MCI9135869.1 hypothetical protein [Lachnospiraceae bacterium]
MWELQIAGEDLYHIINWFWLYSFLGWVWESCYVSAKEKRLVNRGFVMGPVCTIYGFGAVTVYLILKPVSGSMPLLYLGGVIVPTILEYTTAAVMEGIFHTSWWDYSHNKYNFQGRVCLGASLGWGIFSVALFHVLHPFVSGLVELYSVAAGKMLMICVTILYGADFIISFAGAMEISKRLQSMESVMEELYEYVQGTRLYSTAEELRERLELYRLSGYREELRRRFEMRRDAALAFGLELPAEKMEQIRERHRQIEERVCALHERYMGQRTSAGFLTRRFLSAYPHMKSRTQAIKDRALQRTRKRG